MADRIAERHVENIDHVGYCRWCSLSWPCAAITEHRRAEQYRAHADALAKALDAWHDHGVDCAVRDKCASCKALAAYREATPALPTGDTDSVPKGGCK